MQIEKKIVQDKLYIKPCGRLDANTSIEFGTEVNDLLDDVQNLIIDFEDVEYISSMGLRILLEFQKRMAQQGSMTIQNVNEEVMNIFNITGFDKILTII